MKKLMLVLLLIASPAFGEIKFDISYKNFLRKTREVYIEEINKVANTQSSKTFRVYSQWSDGITVPPFKHQLSEDVADMMRKDGFAVVTKFKMEQSNKKYRAVYLIEVSW